MELVLPNNYVVLEQEEMMYLDGGFSIPRWPVATAINIAFNGVLGGGAISLVRNYIRNYGLRRVTSAIAGAAARYVGYELQIEWQDLHCLLLMDLQLGCQLAMLLQQSGPTMM
ncbi:Uncharacterised protein [Streptococcus pneumoniae]|nr:Uncharacterised protein [Streptococcus pneumoniae]SNL10935.1 Uncharacterised protein [Streptococcus pneumoniae]